jgi:O-6-methylguanine DNA methyltransferase
MSKDVFFKISQKPEILVTIDSLTHKVILECADAFYVKSDSEISEEILLFLKAYADKKPIPSPLFPTSTSFCQSVYKQLTQIPFGKTMSYKKVGEEIGKPRSMRGVGTACRINPYPLFIPCHRVISMTGSLHGFAHGITVKKRLLLFEQEG